MFAPLDDTQYQQRANELCFCCSTSIGVSRYRSPLENIAYEFLFISPVVPNISYTSYLDGVQDGR